MTWGIKLSAKVFVKVNYSLNPMENLAGEDFTQRSSLVEDLGK